MLKRWVKRLHNKRFIKNVLLFCASIFILVFGTGVIWVSSFKIPDFASFDDRKVSNSTKIYDRTGEILLYDIYQNVHRTYIPFEEMGQNIKNATIAIEDSEFYNHNGIRLTSIFRATVWAKLTGKSVTGGSTITQQLVKNTLLTSQRSVARKIKEWVLAIKVDKALSKEKILELYLNEVPYGGTIYGIEEASKTYFNKEAINLSLAESAYLAAIPQSPTTLSPYGKNRDKLENRKNLVLSRMQELGIITSEEYTQAREEEVIFQPQAVGGIKAPHFVFFIKEYLEQKYGVDFVRRGGLKVTTTLDYDLEAKAEEIVKEGALENKKNWDGENAGLIAIDPKTGQILAMVGSRNYFDTEVDGNFNITTANRQPGSAFKPFIYATAFTKGFTPNTVLFDLPTEFQSTCDAYGKALPGRNQDDCYMPSNYDDKFRGPMSLREALAQSINVPAVQLFYLAGLPDSLQTAENMGISTLNDINRYGLTLVIGGGEVSLLDLTSAYGVFANNGIRNPYNGVLKIEDVDGNILEEYTPNSREVLPKNTALTISDILSDNTARTPTFGANSVLKIGNKDVAVKTGTTNSNRDAWTIGYTPSIVVGVWAGNNDNRPMAKGGSTVAGPIWNKFMNEALKVLPDEQFESPFIDTNPETVKPVLRGIWQGNENFFIDKISGKLATEFTPEETREEKVITNVHSILYWVDKKNVTGPAPSIPQNDSQFNHFEIPVQEWWAKNAHRFSITTRDSKPTLFDDIHTELTRPKVSIVEPSSTITYNSRQRINIRLNTSGQFPLQKTEVFINNIYVGSSIPPISFAFIPEDLANLSETNEIRVIVYDTAYNKSEAIGTFKVAP